MQLTRLESDMDNTRTTSLGTPWAATWDEGWAACVEGVEADVGRRVCGAKTLAGSPCSLSSGHRTGRCVFHGGTDAIGAPVGNSNARVHGLYARRLQRCGVHCPMWDHCPFASDEVLALELPERPVCAYEAEEYDRVVEGLTEDSQSGGPSSTLAGCAQDLDSTDSNSEHADPSLSANTEDLSVTRPRWNLALPGGVDELRAHNIALLQVMVSRAAAALSVASFTDVVTSESDRYRLATTKVHAALEAFLRLSREHRGVMAQFSRDVERSAVAEVSRSEVSDAKAALPHFPHTNPNATNLAEYALPMLKATDGVVEEAIEAENDRRAYMDRVESMLEKLAGPDWRDEVEAVAEPP